MAILILNDLRESELGKKEMAKRLGKPKPTRYLNDLVRKMVANGLIEFTIPDKPTSRLQKYRLTHKGWTWLDSIHEGLHDFERVRQIFRRRGAYGRYKDLLENRGFLKKWYDFENTRQTETLREWCEENAITLIG